MIPLEKQKGGELFKKDRACLGFSKIIKNTAEYVQEVKGMKEQVASGKFDQRRIVKDLIQIKNENKRFADKINWFLARFDLPDDLAVKKNSGFLFNNEIGVSWSDPLDKEKLIGDQVFNSLGEELPITAEFVTEVKEIKDNILVFYKDKTDKQFKVIDVFGKHLGDAAGYGMIGERTFNHDDGHSAGWYDYKIKVIETNDEAYFNISEGTDTQGIAGTDGSKLLLPPGEKIKEVFVLNDQPAICTEAGNIYIDGELVFKLHKSYEFKQFYSDSNDWTMVATHNNNFYLIANGKFNGPFESVDEEYAGIDNEKVYFKLKKERSMLSLKVSKRLLYDQNLNKLMEGANNYYVLNDSVTQEEAYIVSRDDYGGYKIYNEQKVLLATIAAADLDKASMIQNFTSNKWGNFAKFASDFQDNTKVFKNGKLFAEAPNNTLTIFANEEGCFAVKREPHEVAAVGKAMTVITIKDQDGKVRKEFADYDNIEYLGMHGKDLVYIAKEKMGHQHLFKADKRIGYKFGYLEGTEFELIEVGAHSFILVKGIPHPYLLNLDGEKVISDLDEVKSVVPYDDKSLCITYVDKATNTINKKYFLI